MKKIMFNDKYGLTQAVLDGKKTMTRRVIKSPRRFRGQEVNGFFVYRNKATNEITEVVMKDYDDGIIDGGQILPKYKVGEVIGIAQSYRDLGYCSMSPDISPKDFRITRGTLEQSKGWTNKMFIRSEACKNYIRITGVKVEKLQDISEEDCIKEGLMKPLRGLYGFQHHTELFYSFGKDAPRRAFAALIDKVCGEGTWEINPYVFAYEFELVTPSDTAE
ncbi:MAG: hypothetical protein NC115_12080 [Bacteroidales bacterium]|nr:hypothetical protein [Bacteroidales bacterium]